MSSEPIKFSNNWAIQEVTKRYQKELLSKNIPKCSHDTLELKLNIKGKVKKQNDTEIRRFNQ